MHIRIPQPEFARLLQAAQGVVERKSTMKILECVLLEAEGDGVRLVATDLDVGVRLRAGAEVVAPGSVCVPARKLHEIVRLLPPEPVDLKVGEGNRVEVRCGASVFRIPGLGKEEFPSLPQVGEKGAAAIPRQAFGGMLGKVAFAITNDDSRYALNGCLLTLGKGQIRLVASDGHRLAFAARGLEGGDASAKPQEVIIPKKAIAEVSRMCAEEEADGVEFTQKDNQVLFRCGRREIISRLLEGTFPNYERVIPKENTNVFEVESARLSDAVRRVSLLASEHSRAVRLALAAGKLEVSASSPEQGEAREVLEVAYGGERVHVGFNARYLLDFLGAVGAENVKIALRDKDTQGLLTPAAKGDKDEDDYRYVVMPMRLEDAEGESTPEAKP